MKKRMCIYVSSPKSYKDVFDVFYICKNRFWTDCRYRFVLSTNYEVNYEGVDIINSHNTSDTWVERSIYALSEIDEKYIMLLCDDLLISKRIDSRYIENILNFMDKNNIKFCRLKPLNCGKKVKGHNYLSWVKKNTPYGINLQRGIYRKEYLISLLGDGLKSAWDIEAELLKEAQDSSSNYFADVVACNKNIFPVVHAVDKGKWLPKALLFLKHEHIDVNSSREKMSGIRALSQDIRGCCSNILTPSFRKKIKSLLTKLGLKFTTDY